MAAGIGKFGMKGCIGWGGGSIREPGGVLWL